MLVNIYHDTRAEHRRLLFYGVVFVAVIASLIGTSIAIYQKAFQPVTMVTIKADRAGLQLSQFGDVRVHGVLVGQVRAVEQDGEEASIRVGLIPEAADDIPGNVEVEILPTTLFGQKYISLVEPASGAHRRARRRGRDPRGAGEHQRRAEPDPRRPLPAAPVRAPRRPERDPERSRHRPRRPRRPDRPEPGAARHLPHRDRRAPAHVAQGPGRAGRRRPHLRPGRPRPGPDPAQPDRHRPDGQREAGPGRDLLLRRGRGGPHRHAGCSAPTRTT